MPGFRQTTLNISQQWIANLILCSYIHTRSVAADCHSQVICRVSRNAVANAADLKLLIGNPGSDVKTHRNVKTHRVILRIFLMKYEFI
jgi:hypothetical protein